MGIGDVTGGGDAGGVVGGTHRTTSQGGQGQLLIAVVAHLFPVDALSVEHVGIGAHFAGGLVGAVDVDQQAILGTVLINLLHQGDAVLALSVEEVHLDSLDAQFGPIGQALVALLLGGQVVTGYPCDQANVPLFGVFHDLGEPVEHALVLGLAGLSVVGVIGLPALIQNEVVPAHLIGQVQIGLDGLGVPLDVETTLEPGPGGHAGVHPLAEVVSVLIGGGAEVFRHGILHDVGDVPDDGKAPRRLEGSGGAHGLTLLLGIAQGEGGAGGIQHGAGVVAVQSRFTHQHPVVSHLIEEGKHDLSAEGARLLHGVQTLVGEVAAAVGHGHRGCIGGHGKGAHLTVDHHLLLLIGYDAIAIGKAVVIAAAQHLELGLAVLQGQGQGHLIGVVVIDRGLARDHLIVLVDLGDLRLALQGHTGDEIAQGGLDAQTAIADRHFPVPGHGVAQAALLVQSQVCHDGAVGRGQRPAVLSDLHLGSSGESVATSLGHGGATNGGHTRRHSRDRSGGFLHRNHIGIFRGIGHGVLLGKVLGTEDVLHPGHHDSAALAGDNGGLSGQSKPPLVQIGQVQLGLGKQSVVTGHVRSGLGNQLQLLGPSRDGHVNVSSVAALLIEHAVAPDLLVVRPHFKGSVAPVSAFPVSTCVDAHVGSEPGGLIPGDIPSGIAVLGGSGVNDNAFGKVLYFAINTQAQALGESVYALVDAQVTPACLVVGYRDVTQIVGPVRFFPCIPLNLIAQVCSFSILLSGGRRDGHSYRLYQHLQAQNSGGHHLPTFFHVHSLLKVRFSGAFDPLWSMFRYLGLRYGDPAHPGALLYFPPLPDCTTSEFKPILRLHPFCVNGFVQCP